MITRLTLLTLTLVLAVGAGPAVGSSAEETAAPALAASAPQAEAPAPTQPCQGLPEAVEMSSCIATLECPTTGCPIACFGTTCETGSDYVECDGNRIDCPYQGCIPPAPCWHPCKYCACLDNGNGYAECEYRWC